MSEAMTKFPSSLEEISSMSRDHALNLDPQDYEMSAINRDHARDDREQLRSAFAAKFVELLPEVKCLIEEFEHLRDVEKLTNEDVKFKVIVKQLENISRWSVIFAFTKISTQNSSNFHVMFAYPIFCWAVIRAFGFPDGKVSAIK